MAQVQNLYRMKDLVSLSGVSRQTIHFYLREGLLLPPVRTSKNMAYYDRSTVEDIRFIKELQERRYLPLSVIKEIIKAKREGGDIADEDHLVLFDQLFDRTQIDAAGQSYDEESFMAQADLTKNELEHLAQTGLISHPSGAGALFDGCDLVLAVAFKELISMGMGLEDIGIYASFLQFCRLEIKLVHDRIIHRDPEKQHQSIREIYSKTEEVKNLLRSKAYREFLENSDHDADVEN